MFWYVYTYNRFFIYNIIYVIKHILCYVVFITKMFEIKQNELNAHVCIIYPGPDINSPVFTPDSFFIPKNYVALFHNVQLQKALITGGILHFKKIRPGCQKGNVFRSHLPPKFHHPDPHPNSHPKHPIFIRELLRRTFEKSFISNNFQLPKNPPIPSNHPKISPKNHKIPNKINPFSNKVQ